MKCRKKKCKNYNPAKLQKCKKTCGSCEPLPPSAPPLAPPSAPQLGVNCGGLSDDDTCTVKIKKCEKKPTKTMKCKKRCGKDAKKEPPLCQKTCCKLGFPV